MKRVFSARLLVATALLWATSVRAQDIEQLGGDMTSNMPLISVLELPAPNIRSQEMFNFHLDGHTEFHNTREPERLNGKPVLGPIFNHNSCGGCHVKDGRGPLGFPHKPPGSAVLLKVSLRGLSKTGEARNVPGIGEQIRDHTLSGRSKYNIRVRWRERLGKYPDGTSFKLRNPLITFTLPKISSDKVVYSARMTPPTIGMGLLEAIPEATIVALSDPNDANGDGISGKARYVTSRETNLRALGRFGFRANNPTVKQQSAGAFFNDMGMTNELFSLPGVQQEVSADTMAKVVFYQQAAGLPPARDQSDPDVVAGKLLFQEVGCDDCHKMTLETGPSDVVEVANQTIHPFTDLLLHDMGYGLADKRAEKGVTGREWRTSPLWGLGMHKYIATFHAGYLHDGRARNLPEAILWHGGEATRSRNKFKGLTAAQRNQLIKFLDSL